MGADNVMRAVVATVNGGVWGGTALSVTDNPWFGGGVAFVVGGLSVLAFNALNNSEQ